MQKTYVAKKDDIKRIWYLADASDKILGKLAVRVATILRGKHKVIYTPHIDTGDGVIVINASRIRVTGRKPEQKMYRRHSGYPGGFRELTYKTMIANKPVTVIRLAVKKMLPSGPLANSMLKKLRVYADDKIPHKGLKTTTLEI